MRPFSWDDLQFFLAVARTGQLSAAARKLRTNHATVSRRIDRLENALATKLFERNPRGYLLTSAGEKLVERAEAMEREATVVESDVAGAATSVSGVVRISTLEGFGNFFLADRLPDLAQSLPGLSIELLIIQQIVSLSRREADISVSLSPTGTGSHHCEKVTLYRLFLYATRDYLENHPPVRRRSDLAAHRFIGYIEDMIFTPGLDYHREILPGSRAFYQSSSIHAQLAATRKGLGLCVMPHFMARHYPDLVPVLPKEIHLDRHYWCIVHQDVAYTPRIRMLTDFIKTQARKAEDDFHGQALLT
ncbi:LysR family transcriptional regulator [Mesorhizobium xinjiangense]|uniref:LysR family transcriptional regulator n=1 Tax=Mesorhizobium xinjiangense TaxID=2678685 RepID=UPI0012EDABE4|nr:LysR family transcriptional regulator [Mesorhizobium xinjiangense]